MQAETLRNGGTGGSEGVVWLFGLGVGFCSDVSGGEVGRVLRLVFTEVLELRSGLVRLFSREDGVGDGSFSIVWSWAYELS